MSIPGDLVTEVTVNREVKVRGGPMRGGYSISFNAENDFVLESVILTELRKELNIKMRLKTASKHKDATCGKMQRRKITFKNSKNICQSLPWSSKKYGNRNGGGRKYCQWAAFRKRKR